MKSGDATRVAQERPPLSHAAALRFVIAFGVVSLFADITYEGMRAISGPFLALVGAGSAAVGLIGGGGELLGYTLRLASGSLADRTRLYWPITLAGYLVQMAAVPALALAGSLPAAAALIILERVGKATRNPPRDLMLSRAGEVIGQGWAFGLHEALDQSGAMLGPLIVALVLSLRHDYHTAFGWLAPSALVTLLLVTAVRLRYPDAARAAGAAAADTAAAGTGAAAPARAADVSGTAGAAAAAEPSSGAHRLPTAFWYYSAGAAMVGFGFADFALVSYHFALAHTVPQAVVPALYALAMGAAGLGSVTAGRLYDRRGLAVLLPLTVLVCAYAPLVFLGSFWPALAGAALWGFGLGVHESVMSAAVAHMVPSARRARAFGLFTSIFGIAWFAGSAVLGALYAYSVPATAWLATATQLAALLPIALAARRLRSTSGAHDDL